MLLIVNITYCEIVALCKYYLLLDFVMEFFFFFFFVILHKYKMSLYNVTLIAGEFKLIIKKKHNQIMTSKASTSQKENRSKIKIKTSTGKYL